MPVHTCELMTSGLLQGDLRSVWLLLRGKTCSLLPLEMTKQCPQLEKCAGFKSVVPGAAKGKDC